MRATSREGRSSYPSWSSTGCPSSSARCSATRRASRTWARRCCAARSRTPRRRSRRSSLPSQLEGRRLWFVGIGGAGLSAYAKLARARGAEVGGWDRVETPYVGDLHHELAPEPVVPEGWEVVVS